MHSPLLIASCYRRSHHHQTFCVYEGWAELHLHAPAPVVHSTSSGVKSRAPVRLSTLLSSCVEMLFSFLNHGSIAGAKLAGSLIRTGFAGCWPRPLHGNHPVGN